MENGSELGDSCYRGVLWLIGRMSLGDNHGDINIRRLKCTTMSLFCLSIFFSEGVTASMVGRKASVTGEIVTGTTSRMR